MKLATFFGDMSIRSKLAGGFGLLLLLTIVVGVVGNRALETYSQRSHIVTMLGQVNTGLTEARVEEKNFLLSGNAESAQASRAHGEEVLGVIQRIKPLLAIDADIRALENIQADIQQYQSLMSNVELNASRRDEALNNLETKARILGSSLNAHSSLFFASAMFEDMRRAERRFLVEQ